MWRLQQTKANKDEGAVQWVGAQWRPGQRAGRLYVKMGGVIVMSPVVLPIGRRAGDFYGHLELAVPLESCRLHI